ncbi:ribonuclease H domain-containing protein [Tanacetum coccineum]|uniref:RBR-type E3 ubiquitin transferase n=1 Tax=Tanacetum coccineum TaxID=301880 RepID=A0ABQ5J5V1_9ASTR
MDVHENERKKPNSFYVEKPFESLQSSSNEVFRVYFKYLVSDETLAGIGVSICDKRDRCVFEMKKPIILDGDSEDGVNGEAVNLNALIEALDTAIGMRIKVVHVLCDSDQLCQYLTGKKQPTDDKISTLVDQLNFIQRKFAYFSAFPVTEDVNIAFKLASDAIASAKTLVEQCTICLEQFYNIRMFTVNKCCHKYCHSCIRSHVEAKLLQGMKLPECPHEGCKSRLDIESCMKFLTPKSYEIMILREKEAAIPPAEKVYCPFSNCSYLMSEAEVLKYTVDLFLAAKGTGIRKCVKCHSLFCKNCKVPWHNNVTCSEYMTYNQAENEVKLKSLATKKRWRQCIRCENMVELVQGCYHIYCRSQVQIQLGANNPESGHTNLLKGSGFT